VGSNGPEGMAVLEEIGGLLGSLVWGTLRSVRAWVDAPVEDRSGMFPEDAARRRMAEVLEASPPDNIEGALTDLAQLLEQPADLDPAAVGVACTRIARWADAGAHFHTAAQYYQVAANACLSNADYALAAARAARDLADYARAEVWLQRAVGLARQTGSWETYTRTYLAYGTMMRRRGNVPAARRAIDRAFRRATRHGFAHLRAAASHDLAVIELNYGDLNRAEQHAHDAMRDYPPSDHRVRQLAHDVSCIWVRRGKPRDALAVFRALEIDADAASKPFIFGSIALAAGLSGELSDFRDALRSLECVSPAPGVAEAWTEVAQGALHLNLYSEAEDALARAGLLATSRKEHRIEFLVEDLREQIRSDAYPEAEIHSTASAPDGVITSLAMDFVAALQPA
jgi:tetratricopeptide (TPR) repeat protein